MLGVVTLILLSFCFLVRVEPELWLSCNTAASAVQSFCGHVCSFCLRLQLASRLKIWMMLLESLPPFLLSWLPTKCLFCDFYGGNGCSSLWSFHNTTFHLDWVRVRWLMADLLFWKRLAVVGMLFYPCFQWNRLRRWEDGRVYEHGKRWHLFDVSLRLRPNTFPRSGVTTLPMKHLTIDLLSPPPFQLARGNTASLSSRSFSSFCHPQQ